MQTLDAPPPNEDQNGNPFARRDRGDSLFPKPLRTPPLEYVHLIAWNIWSFVLVAIVFVLSIGRSGRFDLWMAIQLLNMVFLAAGLVGSVVLIRAKRLDRAGSLQPGHWIVLTFTLGRLLWLPLYFLLQVQFYTGMSATAWYPILDAILGCFIVAILAYAAATLKDAWRWTIWLGLSAVIHGIAAVLLGLDALTVIVSGTQQYSHFNQGLYWFQMIGFAILLIALVIVVILDRRRWASRDWIHWLGVGIIALSYSLSTGSQLINWFSISHP
jgi:hypothetical protein